MGLFIRKPSNPINLDPSILQIFLDRIAVSFFKKHLQFHQLPAVSAMNLWANFPFFPCHKCDAGDLPHQAIFHSQINPKSVVAGQLRKINC